MSRRTTWTLAAIVALAAAVRFWALSFGLPHTNARPDENAVIGTAIYFLRGDLQPRFYDYPWLQMWVVTSLDLIYFAWGRLTGWFASYPAFVASWPVHWEPFYVIARALTATLGTATTIVVFWIGRRLWNDAVGLMAAFFLSLSYIHVRDSHYATTDVPMTFLIVLAVACLIDAHLKERPPTAAGAFSGLATATKYGALLLGVPLFISYVVHVVQSPGRRLRAFADAHLWRVGLAFVLALAIGIPFVALDNARFVDAMHALQQSMQQGQGLVPVDSGWVRHLTVSLRYGVGIPLLVAGLLGAAMILVQTPVIGLLLFSFPAAYYAVAASVSNLFFRYIIPVVPFLCLGAASLVSSLARKIVPTSYRHASSARVALATALCLVVIAPSALSVWNVDLILSHTDNRVLLARWFADHVPEGSSVVQSGSMYGHAQFDERLHYTVWLWNKRSELFEVHEREATGRPDWIVIQDSPLPSDTQPILLRFLQEDYVLVQRFVALTLPGHRVYDTQDAFFVPFAGFDDVRRPGPNFTVYRRASATIR